MNRGPLLDILKVDSYQCHLIDDDLYFSITHNGKRVPKDELDFTDLLNLCVDLRVVVLPESILWCMGK